MLARRRAATCMGTAYTNHGEWVRWYSDGPAAAGERAHANPSAPSRRVVPKWFVHSREDILRNIATNQRDRSLAGGVDVLIRPLVDLICEYPQYVTLSSCSGRLVLFHRSGGGGSIEAAPAEGATPDVLSLGNVKRKRGGGGLGTLYGTHAPFGDADVPHVVSAIMSQVRLLQEAVTAGRAQHAPGDLLQLKFEPMILHVMAYNIENAVVLLNAANDAGQRHSGILAVSRAPGAAPLKLPKKGGEADDARRDGGDTKFTVKVTSTLRFDVPLMCNGRWMFSDDAATACVGPSAMTACVRQAVQHAQSLFAENALRTNRFELELRRRAGQQLPVALPS